MGWAAAVLLTALLVGTASAEVYPAPSVGKHLVEEYCLSCHAVGMSDRPVRHDRTPTLAQMAPAIASDPDRYRLFLTNPHGLMEGVSLDRSQIDALFAYILSLPPAVR